MNNYIQHHSHLHVMRRQINITPLERAGRVLIGVIGSGSGIVLMQSSSSLIAGGLEILLVVAGLDMIFTGITGHCPLYAKLGYVPKSLRR